MAKFIQALYELDLLNLLSSNIFSRYRNSMTISNHEIAYRLGSAAFNLYHPSKINNTVGLGPEKDTWNFMYRYNSSTDNIGQTGSRRYQWNKLKKY